VLALVWQYVFGHQHQIQPGEHLELSKLCLDQLRLELLRLLVASKRLRALRLQQIVQLGA
jgi:hypothetical protein